MQAPSPSIDALRRRGPGAVGKDTYKSSAAKFPVPPGRTASGADGEDPVKSVVAAMPRLAVIRQKPIKTVRFAEQPTIVLVVDSPSDEYTFDNKEKMEPQE